MQENFSRSDRVSRLIKEELSNIIRVKLKAKDIGVVSITEIKLSKDMSFAKVYLSVFDASKGQVLSTFKKAVPFFRKELAQKLNLRIVPELAFLMDDRFDRADRVLKILKDLKKNN